MTLTVVQKVDEVYDQLDNIAALCQLFDQQQFTIYKSIAVSLRLLLTESSGDQGLVLDVLPAAVFSPLCVQPTSVVPADNLVLPGLTRIQRGGTDLFIGAGAEVRDLTVAGGAVG